MKKEAQVSMEAMLALSFILLIFLGSLAFVYLKGGEVVTTNAVYEKRSECDRIASLISQTRLQGDGAETKFSTKSKISIFKDSYLIQVQDYKETSYCKLESLETNNYVNLTGNLTITNSNGVIYLT